MLHLVGRGWTDDLPKGGGTVLVEMQLERSLRGLSRIWADNVLLCWLSLHKVVGGVIRSISRWDNEKVGNSGEIVHITM